MATEAEERWLESSSTNGFFLRSDFFVKEIMFVLIVAYLAKLLLVTQNMLINMMTNY